MVKKLALLIAFIGVFCVLRQTGDISMLAPDFNYVLYTASAEIEVSRQDVAAARKNNAVVAEAIRFNGSVADALACVREFSATVLKQEQVGGATVVYAYTPRLATAASLPFGTVNLMLAISNNTITAASPIIHGSF